MNMKAQGMKAPVTAAEHKAAREAARLTRLEQALRANLRRRKADCEERSLHNET